MEARLLTDGERWAREELAALLGARFAPRAVARFLWHSQQRANAERARRPATAARMRLWFAAGAAGWAGAALARPGPFRRAWRGGLAWWAATAVMLDWHIGMLETEDGRPRNLGPADALTLARAWLVPVVADTPAPMVVLLAGATDVLDGRVARASEPTRAGRDLEGLVDTCFAAAALRGAVRCGVLGRAVAAAELTRLGAGFAYALVVYFGRADAPDPAVVRAARLTTPVRAGGLVVAGLGHRRAGSAVLAAGSLWSVAAVARAVRRPRSDGAMP